MDWLVDIGIAVVTYLLADIVTEKVTGEHIHEHVFKWWSRLRDAVSNWLQLNPRFPLNTFIGRVMSVIDRGVVAGKKRMDVLFRVTAYDHDCNAYKITEEVVNARELLDKYPALASRSSIDLPDNDPELKRACRVWQRSALKIEN
jgi:hypothetical protein